MTNPGIYIHIPFCVRKCLYCDFYSVTDASLRGPFVSALKKEIESAAPFPDPPDTLYLGGGTPSLLDPEAISTILDIACRRFSLPAHSEITLEVNPGTITLESLLGYRSASVNRLNIGVQSFDDSALSFLGRCHSGLEARQAVLWAREAGFDNIGLDLIYGLPGQQPETWRKTLKEALAYSPEHFSCYMLTYEAGTPLDRLRESGSVIPLDEDAAAALFDVTAEVLADAGFEHYEISNFARGREMRSRHNQKYWNHTPYIGFGPAAHSFTGRKRRWNVKDVKVYIQQMGAGVPPVSDTETLTSQQLMMEVIYLGLRTSDGIDLTGFEKRFGVSFRELFSSLLQALQEEKLICIMDARCVLTQRGMRFHDYITQRFVNEMG